MLLSKISRRNLIKTATAAVAAGAIRAAQPAQTDREILHELPYSDVTLTGGPLADQYRRIHAHFLSLDNDRLLKVYRQRAGLPAPGEDMGGWYDADGFVPGHTLGQYISGLSRFYSTTGDTATVAKVKALVEGYAPTLGPDGYPYASAKAATTWPCYILDKYEIGMIDADRLAGVSMAKDVLTRAIRGAIPHIPDHTYDRGPNSPKQAPYDEPYILPENLFNTWELTGERQFFDMAKLYLLDREYFDPLARGENILPGKHAYSHAIALSSAAKAYLVLGDPKYLKAIQNAWDMLASSQQYASGGWGTNEAFVPPNEGKLGESLTTTRDHFETPCGCYAHMKLARYLIRFTAGARYGDGLERVLYNTILAAKDPDNNGDYFYYSDYHALAKKGYYKRKWPCCSGTLAQTVADYPISVYFGSANGIYVNLFTPSEARFKIGGTPVKLVQTTQYPHDGAAAMRIELPLPAEFTVAVRIPGWAAREPKLTVNGKPFDIPVRQATFATIRRRWKNHDTIELDFPLDFRTEAIDRQHPETVALMRGPLMYVAVNPDQQLDSTPLRIPTGLTPTAHAQSRSEYALENGKVQFRPFYMVEDETYNTYFRKA